MTDRLDLALADAVARLRPWQTLNPSWPTARPERKPRQNLASNRTILRHETGVELWEDKDGFPFKSERSVRATQTVLAHRTQAINERLIAARAADAA
jgi:hypothetical protein